MAKNKTDSIEFSSVAVGFAIYHNPVKVGLIAKKHAERCGIHSKLFSILKRRFVSLIAKTGSGFLRIRAK